MCLVTNKRNENNNTTLNIEDDTQLDESIIIANPQLPEHVDNPFLNTDIKNGVLGFRYENKNAKVTVYSNVETKHFAC